MKFISILSVIGILVASKIYLLDTNNDGMIDKIVNEEGTVFVDNLEDNTIKEKIVYDKLSNATITATNMKDNIISTDSSFDLTFDKDVSKEYVENVFSIKPKNDLKVEQIDTKHFRLLSYKGLSEDQIYNIEEKTTEGTTKWAFQTEKVFRVDYTYPDNGSFITETGAPEIAFNGKISNNISINDYIKITPNIAGEWKKSYSYNYRFEHKDRFEKNTTYEITVKKGLQDEEGNVLKEDYVVKFEISNEQDISANLSILNNYKPNTNIDLSLNLNLNLNKALSLKDANIKIYKLASKEAYIKALKDVAYIEKLKEYSEKTPLYTKDLIDLITNKYNEAKKESKYYYYEEVPVDSNLIISEEGYYLAMLNINSNLSSALFQVNNTTATVSTLADNNFMILYKGKDGNNNSVDVYINDEKLGTTNDEGLLYIESFRNIIKNLNEEINVIEFKNGNVNYIYDISNQVSQINNGENMLTSMERFNNGYIYVDRNYYKPGETIHFWGYAKNRKIKVNDAKLEITSNSDDLLQQIDLKLSEVGTFEGEYTISDVNKESYISLALIIGDSTVYSRYVEVRDYELKQYQIDVKPESRKYLDGDTAVINISANTYDGTPLKDLELKYKTDDNYYSNSAVAQSGSVKTDEFGNATIKIKLQLKKEQTNLQPEGIRITVLNSYIDGEQESVYFTVYPYKHSADGKVKYIVDENKYYISLNEYLSLDDKVPANDKIKVVAKAYKTVRTVTGTQYNKYTKEMEDVVEYEEVAQSAFDKSFVVNMKDGKGAYELEKFSKDKNCYYRFYAYLITESGKELALNYNGEIYSYSYKTIYDENEYEEVEYVDPIILPGLTYNLYYEINNKLKVGDEVYFYLQDNKGRRIKDYSKFEFYTLVVSADGNKIIKNKGERPHFTFTKEMGANAFTYTICYDTLKTYVPSSNNSIYYAMDSYIGYIPNSTIRLCEEELSLNLDIKYDKEIYEPRDEAKVKIKVLDGNKGVKAGVKICAVDTAYVDANGKVDTNIIGSLYNNYYISSSSGRNRTYSKNASKSLAVNSMDMMAPTAMAEEAMMDDEAGGGMGGEGEVDVRDDLRVTAFFESVITDENGEAEVSIILPDNITEWTISAEVISNEFKAKSEEKTIKVSKDFYATLNLKDRYLVGEHFAFNIKSFSKLYAGKDVLFNIQILDENNKVIEEGSVKSKAQEVLSYKVKKPISKKGIYKVKITGTCENLKDTMIDEIEIVESLMDSTIREELLVKVGDKIAIVSPKGYLYILNEDVARVLPTLFDLIFLYNNERNDTTLISEEASRIFNNLCNGNEFEYSKKYKYEAEKTIFKVMKNSSDDARLALRMLSTKAIRLSSDEVAEKIEVRLGNMAMLWAKVNMESATLKELYEAKNDLMSNISSYKVEDALYLALAFADVGSTNDAIEIYNMVSDKITDKDEIEYELKLILAIKLNHKDMEDLYSNYISKEEELLPENSDFVKLYYVQNALSKNFKKGIVVLSINGINEIVEVNNVGLTRKLIKGKDDIKVVSITDNLSFMIEQYKPVDFNKIDKKGYIISKTYSNPNAKEGDIVDVMITIDNKKMYDEGQKYGCVIEDAIPNNMTFVEYYYNSDYSGYLRKQDGQKLTISFWNPYDPKYNPSKTISTLKYKVRVTNSGEQYEPGTIMSRYNNQIVDGIK